jgi:hypothetical protein
MSLPRSHQQEQQQQQNYRQFLPRRDGDLNNKSSGN